MAKYMAVRIIEKAFGEDSYDYVIERRPDLKPGIDAYLIEQGYGDLITKIL